jgi:hypothetical protein
MVPFRSPEMQWLTHCCHLMLPSGRVTMCSADSVRGIRVPVTGFDLWSSCESFRDELDKFSANQLISDSSKITAIGIIDVGQRSCQARNGRSTRSGTSIMLRYRSSLSRKACSASLSIGYVSDVIDEVNRSTSVVLDH